MSDKCQHGFKWCHICTPAPEIDQERINIVSINPKYNSDAVEMLELALKQVRAGKIKCVAMAWVNSNSSIGGDVSSTDDKVRLWAALEHSTKSYYLDAIRGESDE